MSEETPTLLEIADELYGLGLSQFTPARDARAKELKGTDLAAQVKALRKPSLAAWVVNLLVRREAGQVEQVLQVGAALREAQAGMSATELRALTRQRRQLTAAVTQQARSLASEEGVRVTGQVADQVEATLTAAMVDEGCGRAVRSGLLVSALSATGVDEVDVTDALAVPNALGFEATARETPPTPRPDLRVVPDPEAELKARAAAQERLAAAQEAVDEAQTGVDEISGTLEELRARQLQVEAEVDELRRRIAELEATSDEVDDDLGDAEEALTEARSSLEAAAAGRDSAQVALDELE